MVMNLRPHFLAYPVGRVKMNQHVNIGVVFAWPIMDIKDDVIHKPKVHGILQSRQTENAERENDGQLEVR